MCSSSWKVIVGVVFAAIDLERNPLLRGLLITCFFTHNLFYQILSRSASHKDYT